MIQEKKKKMIKFLTSIFVIGVLFLHASNVYTDELTHKFKNPSFSGVGTSSHYLTVENQEKSRRDSIQDDIESALKQAERDEEKDWNDQASKDLHECRPPSSPQDILRITINQNSKTPPSGGVFELLNQPTFERSAG